VKTKLLSICGVLLISCAAVNAGDIYAVGTGRSRGEALGNAMSRLPSWAIIAGTHITMSGGLHKTTTKNGTRIIEMGSYICKIKYSSVRK